MKKNISLLFFLLLMFSFSDSFAQKRGANWCFGDSAGIDFNVPGSPVTFTNSVVSRGTCVSISDTAGSLQFYAITDAQEAGVISGVVWNKNNQIMLGGDSIAGSGWYHEMVILPDPADDSLFYLFSIGVSYPYGLKYSKIDLRGDNGLGEVVQKNVLLISNTFIEDGLTAIKHGNGRDWWLICRPYTYSQFIPLNDWYVFRISPSGIDSVNIQNIGSMNAAGFARIISNREGNKLCFINYVSIIELFDFDRCTGLISNPVNIEQEVGSPYPGYWSAAFSPNGRYLYLAANTTYLCSLYQFDTWAPVIDSTKTLLWQTTFPHYTIGDLKLVPDNKIYLSMCYVDSAGNDFPYAPGVYNSYNMNLSVINSPDSAGMACDFQPYSFSLGGNRTYWGLPNNPDYDLPALAGSPCDTLLGVAELTAAESGELSVYYSPTWQTTTITAQKLHGREYMLTIYDLLGNEIFREEGKLQSSYFTKNVNSAAFANGMYVVKLQVGREVMVKKFIVE